MMRMLRLAPCAAMVVLAAAAGLPSAAASASEPPPAITEWFATNAATIENPETGDAYDGTVTASSPVEVFTWTTDYIQGIPTDSPTQTTGIWAAALLLDGKREGVLEASLAENESVELKGYGTDVDLARAVQSLTADEYLVHDAPNGAYYAVLGNEVRPLTHWAFEHLEQPTTLDAFQPTVAKSYADKLTAAEDARTSELLRASFAVLIALAVAAATITLVVWLSRRRG